MKRANGRLVCEKADQPNFYGGFFFGFFEKNDILC
jgi:hypothetical protein